MTRWDLATRDELFFVAVRRLSLFPSLPFIRRPHLEVEGK